MSSDHLQPFRELLAQIKSEQAARREQADRLQVQAPRIRGDDAPRRFHRADAEADALTMFAVRLGGAIERAERAS